MAEKHNKGTCEEGTSSASEPLKQVDYHSEAPDTSSNPESESTDFVSLKFDIEPKKGYLTVPIKTQNGETLNLQLNPGDSVIDIRRFLLGAPETCYFTCYDLVLHVKDGSTHHLEDYNYISEVADITTGGCSLEMVAVLYNDRSVRAHVHRTRDLLSLAALHSSSSTSLALQYKTAPGKSRSPEDASKIEYLELDDLNFLEDVPGSLENIPSTFPIEIKSVESLDFSFSNPPRSHRRLEGDLIYLDIVTLEGNKYCITGATKMFYVNSATGNVLDPRSSKTRAEATTLIGLLQKISPKFKRAFREILEKKYAAHPFEIAQCQLPPNSWLGLPHGHKCNASRGEDARTLSYGSELMGMQRDWNEELQSCREFPRTTPQERVFRDRALYKVTSDFVNAAIRGAVGVINGCVFPINPADPEHLHVYVDNNIFFFFVVDADLEHLSNKRASDTYTCANNNLNGTKALQEADVAGLYNLSMVIIDYRGYRVVAQNILPGILQGDKSNSIMYGSVDNGKKICWNEGFHSKVLEAAKRLQLKEHKVLDALGNVFKLAVPVECKGMVGSDGRHYLLDLMRLTPRDANYTGPGSQFCILRRELVTAFCTAQLLARLECKPKAEGEANVAADSAKADGGDPASTVSNIAVTSDDNQVIRNRGECEAEPENSSALFNSSKSCEEILLNVNVLTELKLSGSKEEIEMDEENVRKASSYLLDVVIPKFIQDLCALEVSPMDGQSLSEALHASGINVRYVGKVANGTKNLPRLWDLCSNEILVRSAKHIFKDILRDTNDNELGHAISHFLNCLFGNSQSIGAKSSSKQSKTRKDQAAHHSLARTFKGCGKQKVRAYSNKSIPSYTSVSSGTLWSDIQEFVREKYQFDVVDDSRSQMKKVSVIRNFCQKVGITISARKYDLNAAMPFQTSDILNLQPVVKHSVPASSKANMLVDLGKMQLAKGMFSNAYMSFSEALSILQQVTGPMHRQAANCCRYLAMVLFAAGDMDGALMQQHKELIINERCLGLDHPDTAHSYGKMAVFYNGANETKLGLQHMSRALILLGVSSGLDHPDVAAAFVIIGTMYGQIGKINTALHYLTEALKKSGRLLGEEHIQTAACSHALAVVWNSSKNFNRALEYAEKTYNILVKQLGEDDPRTRDSKYFMEMIRLHDVEKSPASDGSSAPTHDEALEADKAGKSVVSISRSLSEALIGKTFPRGYEGASAAQVKKKS